MKSKFSGDWPWDGQYSGQHVMLEKSVLTTWGEAEAVSVCVHACVFMCEHMCVCMYMYLRMCAL